LKKSGNGKRHRTPSPRSLKKVKRVGFNIFLGLKELVNSVKVYKTITPRGNRKKSVLRYKNSGVTRERHYAHEYEPSTAVNANSSLRRWHRVNEWHEYVNDTGRINKRDT